MKSKRKRSNNDMGWKTELLCETKWNEMWCCCQHTKFIRKLNEEKREKEKVVYVMEMNPFAVL